MKKGLLAGFMAGVLLTVGSLAFAATGPVETKTSAITLATPANQVINQGKLVSNAVNGTSGTLYVVSDAARKTNCYVIYNGSGTTMSCVRYY